MRYTPTKRGKPIKPPKRNGFGFHWTGRDDNGVSVWDGQTGAMRFGVWTLVVMGGLEIAAAAVLHYYLPEPVVSLVIGGSGLFLLGLAWWGEQFRRHVLSMASLEEAATKLGVGTEDVQRLISDYNVRPRIILNGEPVYDPADFTEHARLLRPSAAPVDGGLLRPAGFSGMESETLLRAGRAVNHEDTQTQRQENH
jgi:hypothetical protein